MPGATVLEMTRFGPQPVAFEDTAHFRLYSSFVTDPRGFVAAALAGEEPL